MLLLVGIGVEGLRIRMRGVRRRVRLGIIGVVGLLRISEAVGIFGGSEEWGIGEGVFVLGSHEAVLWECVCMVEIAAGNKTSVRRL